MDRSVVFHALILLTGVFVGAISQVMLKKSALKKYDDPVKEYLNPLVIFAYVLFVGTTFLSILAYRGIPLSMGPVLESTSYIYVTVFGVKIFGEKVGRKKVFALAVIILGIFVFSVFG
jgi:multidrug transporter EmrE-like cation transporter